MLQPTGNIVRNTIGVYATPLQEVTAKAMFTNTSPVGPYRGAGRPEGNYYIERLLDTAAREMGIDPTEIRRRNHIQPDAFPYKTPAGTTYDSGDFPPILDKALAAADWDGFAARKKDSAERGKLRGSGIGQYLEVTGPPAPEMGGIRFEPDGTVTIITGTLDYGQGHASPFAQVLASRLGIPFDKINLLQGDSDELLAGGGTGGSKSLMASGTAIIEGAEKVREAGTQDRRPCAGGRRSRYRVRDRPSATGRRAVPHRRHRPLDRHHGAGGADPLGRGDAAGGRAADPVGVARRRGAAVRLSRTAAMSPRSRSIPRPGSPRWSAITWSTISA